MTHLLRFLLFGAVVGFGLFEWRRVLLKGRWKDSRGKVWSFFRLLSATTTTSSGRGIGQALDLESPGRLDERAEVILKDVDFSTVHILK